MNTQIRKKKYSMKIYFTLLISIFIIVIIFTQCKDPWEEYKTINVETNIIEQIKNNNELSRFYDILKQTKWLNILTFDQNYSIWVPDNNAMNLVSADSLKDTAYVNKFIANHIYYTKITYFNNSGTKKIKMFSNKHLLIDFSNKKIADANLKEPYDIVVKNGVIHIINKPLIPQKNIWEIIETTNLCKNHTSYLNSLSKIVFDPSIAIQIGYDPITGNPIYDTASGMVWKNDFIFNIRDLRDEELESTVILLSDDVFDQEFQKFSKYYVGTTQQVTISLTNWYIARDLVFDKIYETNDIPDTLISLFGTKVPFNKNAIDTIIHASNGVIYVLHDCSVRLQDKIRPIIIEAEDMNKIVYVGTGGYKGYTRKKPLASGGYDFVLDNHKGNPGYIRYKLPPLVATTYQIYWKAVNDFNGRINGTSYSVLQQSLTTVQSFGMKNNLPIFGDPADPPLASLVTVTDTMYETSKEIYLADWNLLYYFTNFWFQVTSGNKDMAITLDYIKLVPVLNK